MVSIVYFLDFSFFEWCFFFLDYNFILECDIDGNFLCLFFTGLRFIGFFRSVGFYLDVYLLISVYYLGFFFYNEYDWLYFLE